MVILIFFIISFIWKKQKGKMLASHIVQRVRAQNPLYWPVCIKKLFLCIFLIWAEKSIAIEVDSNNHSNTRFFFIISYTVWDFALFTGIRLGMCVPFIHTNTLYRVKAVFSCAFQEKWKVKKTTTWMGGLFNNTKSSAFSE